MRYLIALVLGSLFVVGCCPERPSPDKIAQEKKKIESLITDFWKAHESKDSKVMNKFISGSPELLFFGSDSAEVIRSLAQWERQKHDDMLLFQSLKAGAPANLSIQVDSDAELSSAFGEIPLDVNLGGEASHSLDRFALVMKKENGEWRIIQGMITFATVGQSSAELVARMKEQK